MFAAKTANWTYQMHFFYCNGKITKIKATFITILKNQSKSN